MKTIDRKQVISLDIFTFDCNGCERCVHHCLHGVLDMVDNGFCRYAVVKYINKCTGCGKCLQVCQTHAMRLVVAKEVYA